MDRIISRKEADRRRTFGYRRAEVIGALINLLLLTFTGLYLLYETATRYFNPQDAQGWPMIIAAGLALIVDIATGVLLFAVRKGSINLRAGFVHKLADALASVAVIVGGVVILLKEWYLIDLVITITLAGYILWQSLKLLKPTISILMESVPADIDVAELAQDVSSIQGVAEIHHVHVWELDEEHRASEAHVVIDAADVDPIEQLKLAIKQRLEEAYSIRHSTLEFEFENISCPSPYHGSSVAKS